MADTRVDDELWNEFHRVVNMSSRELGEWLRTRSAQPDAERFPDQSGTPPASMCSPSWASAAPIWTPVTSGSCAPWSTACTPNAAPTSNPPRVRPAGAAG